MVLMGLIVSIIEKDYLIMVIAVIAYMIVLDSYITSTK